MLEWKENVSTCEWDNYLTSMRGHLLQSGTWGDSRDEADNLKNIRLVALLNGIPVYMARVEVRYFMKLFKVAWIPRGPVDCSEETNLNLHSELLKKLRQMGFFLCCTNPWIEIKEQNPTNFLTIWIDLNLGKDRLFANLHKQFRYDVRRARKQGVIVEKSEKPEDVIEFYNLCKELGVKKGFVLPASLNMMLNLIKNKHPDYVESYLFCARHEGNFCGGAFISRCGENIHYMWGAVNRKFFHLSVGEIIQWEVIEWGISNNCKKYDLEGISYSQASGTDYFKKKTGGSIIHYSGIQYYPLKRISKLALALLPHISQGNRTN